MAVVNSLASVKDSRWLQLEVCREYQRNKCTRSDTECKFAHPPAGVDIQNGRVVACYDSIKGRCNREKPPCKYFHPPQHLKDQLLINGRNHLAFKNALLHQMPIQTVLTAGQIPLTANPYVTNLPGSLLPNFSPGIASSPGLPYALTPAALAAAAAATRQLTSNFGVLPAPALITSNKAARTDRLEVCREFQRGNCSRPENECRFAHPPEHVQIDPNSGLTTVCMDYIKSRCSRSQCRYFHPPCHLQSQLKSVQNRTITSSNNNHSNPMSTFPAVATNGKRTGLEKAAPMLQPLGSGGGVSAYQLALHQSFVPLTPNMKQFQYHQHISEPIQSPSHQQSLPQLTHPTSWLPSLTPSLDTVLILSSSQ